MGGCASKNVASPRIDVESNRAGDLLAKIGVGMTFDEISRIIPLSTNLIGMQTAGSIWFHVPVDARHTIRLRFNRPAADRNLHPVTLNLPPEMILEGAAR
jgi:hypothetical protein